MTVAKCDWRFSWTAASESGSCCTKFALRQEEDSQEKEVQLEDEELVSAVHEDDVHARPLPSVLTIADATSALA